MKRGKKKKSLGHKIYFTFLLLIFLFGCTLPAKYDTGPVGRMSQSENRPPVK